MKFLDATKSAMSGSQGGTTYSHNRYGYYTRMRVIPVNPNSTRQQARRAEFSRFAQAWKDLGLTPQAQWTNYAANTPVVDRLGQTQYITGMNMYIRINAFRVIGGLDAVSVPPGVFGGTILTPPSSVAYASSANEVTFNLDLGDAWINEPAATAAMLIFASNGRSAARYFYGGPYIYQSRVQSGVVANPVVRLLPDIVAASGQKVFFRFCATLADGRMSASCLANAVAV